MLLILNNYLIIILLVVCVLQAIAFITLYERHLLGLSQNRIGPTVVSLKGVLQAFMDGLKLIKKEQILPLNSSLFLFLFVPGIAFIMILVDWIVLPYNFNFITFDFSIIFFLCLVGFRVYTTIIRGVVSKSKYPMLGSVRSRSQSVSFEIAFSIYLFCMIFYFNQFAFITLFNFNLVFLLVPFVIIILAELNRAPFDFSEGERELVRGFNVEYARVGFVFLFLREYGILILFSILFSTLFLKFSFLGYFFIFSVLIFIRSSYPRYRYDILINFFWFKLLPLSIIFLFYYYFILLY
jgi:NADH:ubiquinone oxidoreductase subunit H